MPYRKIFWILFFLAVASLAPHVGFSQEGRIAVLPMEDLSQGSNGLNLEITRRVRESMANRGFVVASHDEVVLFMVRNRVRWLGHLGSQYLRRLHDELAVDYLLLGSVTQRRDERPMALAITLQLIRTDDMQITWTGSASLCAADEIGLLGLSEVESMAELEDMVVEKALRNHPQQLSVKRGSGALRDIIESVSLGPKILRPGEMVRCRVKLGGSVASLRDKTVSVIVDGTSVETSFRPDENSFVASWAAAAKNERYPVVVVISRPGAKDREVLVGSYLVDGRIPALALHLKGQELDGMVVLQKNVAITPVLDDPEPIKSWRITVRDINGAVIMRDEGKNGLPSRFAWWGQAKNGALVADGFYAICLTVWDRAGNSASAEETIRVIRQQPQMSVAMKEQDERLALNLEYDGEIPLAYWRLEIQNQEGDIILESSGTEVTERLMLPLAKISGQKINYRLYTQDILGNRLRSDVATLVPMGGEKADDANFLAETAGQKMALREIWAEDF